MNVETLSQYFERLEKTSSRIQITTILAELFNKLDEKEIDKAIYMMLGRLAPSYENVIFNLADEMVQRAVAKTYNVDITDVKKRYKEFGDIGSAASSFASPTGKRMSVFDLYTKLREISTDQGTGSQDKKIDKLVNILSALDKLSVRYITRIPLGRLRLGFSDKTVIDALSWAEAGDKSKSKMIEASYHVLPDIGLLASKIKKSGIDKLQKEIKPIVGVPVLPMLAQRLKSADAMIKKMGKVSIEPKFDGLRVQIHFKKGEEVKAFTRNLNNISSMFPELNQIGDYLTVDSAIFDSEAVGLDTETMRLADFQTTMQRRRKHEILESAKSIPLTFQIFDVLSINGESLMDTLYLERRKKLLEIIKTNKIFIVDEYLLTEDPEEIRKEHQRQIKKGLEGVLVKKVDSGYVPGRVGWRWVKMKEREESAGKLADTIDAVIMGYTQGKGKRASFGLGQFLAGIVDGEKIKTITKVGTGLTDEQFKELKARLFPSVVSEMPKEYEVHKDLAPDFWVIPKVIVELAADELTVSPKHTAGMALRFPRLVKFRDDKPVREATTLKEIKKLYKLQGK